MLRLDVEVGAVDTAAKGIDLYRKIKSPKGSLRAFSGGSDDHVETPECFVPDAITLGVHPCRTLSVFA